MEIEIRMESGYNICVGNDCHLVIEFVWLANKGDQLQTRLRACALNLEMQW
jgi:hypothetical protein